MYLFLTGKVCPELTASVFGSQLPPCENQQLTVASVSGKSTHVVAEVHFNHYHFFSHCAEEGIPGTGKNVTPAQAITLISKASGTSSPDVSQLVPQSCVSPVLVKYKEYLQSCYKARALASADKYLPTLDVPYINLAMVGREWKYCDPHKRDEFIRQTLHGGVDQILGTKTPINIENLLTPDPDEYGGRPIRFILVEGPPGIGKSTFAWEVCRRWDGIESLRDYHTVVLLKLREKWVLNATSLSDLFRFPFKPEFSKYIAEELYNSLGVGLLLVLDGFDEVSHSFHENSVIKCILCRQLLPQSTIILTTRPVAKVTLESICQPHIDKHIEIIGFTEEDRVRYINKVFCKKPELQKNFLKYMFLVPHIKSMMYIPLNCAIIAQVYYESQSSHHLAIPRTRTQLYKALTHSLLVRHIKMKESNFEHTSMLPEGLNKADMEMFKLLAKFAFHSYHQGEPRKVTFFKEDIPEGLIHFGFMNESTEMYAGKGVERTLSFLHLSLQEYLAAWHLADSYSIEFQVAYHGLAVSQQCHYDLQIKEEKALISLLEPLGKSLVEPAIFLAGITGWRCQSEDGRNHWEMYLSHDTAHAEDTRLSVLLQSLYEAQNPTIISHYFSAENTSRRSIGMSFNFIPVNCSVAQTPYNCYALSYCLAHCSDELSFFFNIRSIDMSLIETFVKGLEDHSYSTKPRVKHVGMWVFKNISMYWLMRTKFLSDVKEINFQLYDTSNVFIRSILKSMVKLQSLVIHIFCSTMQSWEWLTALKSLSQLKILRITGRMEFNSPPMNFHSWWPVEHGLIEGDKLIEVVFDIKFRSNNAGNVYSSTDVLVDSVLKSILRSNQITEVELSNISRQTMVGVRSILLHCPSLDTLQLKRTRLGYDGILYICSPLRNKSSLRHILIYDDLQLPPMRERIFIESVNFTSFTSMQSVPLPNKITCTEFLLQLNQILKENTTLEDIKIQSGLFLPLSASEYKNYCQWTGLGPLQQFNVGAVGSGMSHNLRRSFSSSDLTQPQTLLFWNKQYDIKFKYQQKYHDVDFKEVFFLWKMRKKIFSLPSFTAPDTDILQSFSGLDPRLKECLEVSHLHQHVERLEKTCQGMMRELREYIHQCTRVYLPQPVHRQPPSLKPSYLQSVAWLEQPAGLSQPSYQQQLPFLPQPPNKQQPTYQQHLLRSTYQHQPAYPLQPTFQEQSANQELSSHQQQLAYPLQPASYHQLSPYRQQTAYRLQPAKQEVYAYQQPSPYQQQSAYQLQPAFYYQSSSHQQQPAYYYQMQPAHQEEGAHQQPSPYQQQSASLLHPTGLPKPAHMHSPACLWQSSQPAVSPQQLPQEQSPEYEQQHATDDCQ